MVCVACGSAITTGAPRFCANCGAPVPTPPVTGEQAAEPVQPSVPPGAGPPPSPPPKAPGEPAGQRPPTDPSTTARAPTTDGSKGTPATLVVAIVILLAVAALAFNWLTRSGESESAATSSGVIKSNGTTTAPQTSPKTPAAPAKPAPSPEESDWIRLWLGSGPELRSAQCQYWREDPAYYLRTGMTSLGWPPELVTKMMNRYC
ncbi:unannotated protein [freshwater metagenome]|uniref:Unannotated protein n=1 Tax=freshwater metagenome TaxID=449393 RepID=A0A6J7M0P7_9ZZZZ